MQSSMPSRPRSAAILIIGNEVLSGRTQDQNIQFLASRLGQKGIDVQEIRVVPDQAARIIEAVNTLRAAYDYLFTTGGIGPTHDDITAESVAMAFERRLLPHPDAVARLEKYYGPENVTPARLRMAQMPDGATLIDNPVSGAPGFRMENVCVMAGVPRIMQAMFDTLLPSLMGGPPLQTRTVTCQIPESVLADDLRRLAQRYADIDIGSYPYFHPQKYEAGKAPGLAGLGVSLVFRGVDPVRLEAAAQEMLGIITRLGGAGTLEVPT